MAGRSSFVSNVNIKSMIFDSVFEIGDSQSIQAYSNVFAVQREKQLFFGNEGNPEQYPVFSWHIPMPPPIQITSSVYNGDSSIRVNQIHILALSASPVFQIGNTGNARLESRILHIRQLNPRKNL